MEATQAESKKAKPPETFRSDFDGMDAAKEVSTNRELPARTFVLAKGVHPHQAEAHQGLRA